MKVFYFSWIREYIGVPQEDLIIRSATVRGLIDELTEKGPRYKEAFKDTEREVVATSETIQPVPEQPVQAQNRFFRTATWAQRQYYYLFL